MPAPNTNDNQTRQLLAFNIPNVVIFGVLLWGAFTTPAPLKSSRPSSPEAPNKLDQQETRVSARLWQDPLSAIHRVVAQNTGGTQNILETSLDRIVASDGLVENDGKKKDPPGGDQLILLVLLDGSPFPEAYEARLRTRYAITTALLEDDYQAPNESTLTVVKVGLPVAPNSLTNTGATPKPTTSPTRPVYLAYQEFEPSSPDVTRTYASSDLQDESKKRFDYVHVFYVDQTALTSGPHVYNAITKLLDALIVPPAADDSGKTRPARIHPCVIGPTDSNVFLDLLKDIGHTASPASDGVPSTGNIPLKVPVIHHYATLRFYAPAPTIPDQVVQKILCDEFSVADLTPIMKWHSDDTIDGPDTTEMNKTVANENNCRISIPTEHLAIYRGYGDDLALIDALLDELKLRGIDGTSTDNSIALVTELDGLYGQTMRQEVLRESRIHALRAILTHPDGWCDNRDEQTRIKAHLIQMAEASAESYEDDCTKIADDQRTKLDQVWDYLKTPQEGVSDTPYSLGKAFTDYLSDVYPPDIEPTDPKYRLAKGHLFERIFTLHAQKLYMLAPGEDSQEKALQLLVQCPTITRPLIHLRTFSYLRGLDGQAASSDAPTSQSSTEDKNGKDSSNDDKSRSTNNDDLPQGESQTDYLRRLASRLTAEESESLASGRRPLIHFRAIGVTGSDVYDKLLVIRALRRDFPSAVFFTTDLDASYFDPTEIKYTAGLITASRYFLRQDHNSFFGVIGDPFTTDAHPLTVSPFRDSYQSATFISCLHALSYRPINLVLPPQFILPQVRIYQLDSDNFIPLISSKPHLGTRVQDNFSPEPGTKSDPNSKLSQLPSIWYLQYLVLFLTGALLGFGLFFGTDWLRQIHENSGAYIAFLLVMGICVTLCFYIRHLSAQPDEEPFVLWGSMSTWPTTIIRGIAIILALIFIWNSYRLFKVSRKPRRIELMHLIRRMISSGVTFDYSPKAQSARSIQSEPPDYPEHREHSNRLYRLPDKPFYAGLVQYEALKLPYRRFLRTFLLCLLFGLFAWAAIKVWDSPWIPTRGSISRGIYETALFFSIVVPLYLVFYIIDAIALCQSLVIWLTNRISDCGRKIREMPGFEIGKKSITADCADRKEIVQAAGDVIYLIGDRTRIVQQIIYYPFICLLLLLFSRDANFSRYDWPVSLFLIIPIPYLILGLIVTALQIDAKKARKQVLLVIDNEMGQCKNFLTHNVSDVAQSQALAGTVSEPVQHYSDFLAQKRDDLISLKTGAYELIYNSPLFQSVLIPLGGIGGIQFVAFVRQFFGS